MVGVQVHGVDLGGACGRILRKERGYHSRVPRASSGCSTRVRDEEIVQRRLQWWHAGPFTSRWALAMGVLEWNVGMPVALLRGDRVTAGLSAMIVVTLLLIITQICGISIDRLFVREDV